MIYLDYNATAPVRPEVLAVMQALMAKPLNASSVHSGGREAKKILEESRKIIAEAINCFANEVIFVGTGSEANNWALSLGRPLVSAVEHASVLKTSQACHASGSWHPEFIPVNSEGVVDLAWLDACLRRHDNEKDKIKLVSVILANNETGVIQPIKEIAEIVHKHGALLHTDAVQALGKIPLDFSALGADLMTISAHKMGGPVGAAALIVKNNMPIQPFIRGGGQELNRRAGTENIAAIAGFAEAVKRIDLKQMEVLRGWLSAAEDEILKTAPDAMVMGKGASRLPNTSCIAMPKAPSETQLIAFDLENIAISAGSACSSGRIEASHVLKAMKVSEPHASGAIRVSGGWGTTETEIKAFVNGWKKLYQRLSTQAA